MIDPAAMPPMAPVLRFPCEDPSGEVVGRGVSAMRQIQNQCNASSKMDLPEVHTMPSGGEPPDTETDLHTDDTTLPALTTVAEALWTAGVRATTTYPAWDAQ